MALLHHGEDPTGAHHVRRLSAELGDAGVSAQVVRARSPRGADALLRARSFTEGLAGVPYALPALLAGRFDLAHAFTPQDALAAHAWRRLLGGPALFTCTETLDRATVADRRLRLALLRRAVEDSDAVLAANEDVRAALWRWMAVEAPVAGAGDAAVHETLYREVLGRAA